VDVEEGAVGLHGGAAEDVFEFADVAGPLVGAKDGGGGQRDAGEGLAVLRGELADEVRGERGEVVGAGAEGRDAEFDHADAVEEVLTELSGGGEGLEVAVGCGDDAGLDAARLGGADAEDLVGLQGAEELGLGGEGHFADLVEEECAAVRGLEESGAVGGGAGECAFDVAEEFGLEEGFDDGAGVADDEGAVCARGEVVEGAGDEFLAGSGFAGDERGAEVGADAFELGAEALHGEAGGDHAVAERSGRKLGGARQGKRREGVGRHGSQDVSAYSGK